MMHLMKLNLNVEIIYDTYVLTGIKLRYRIARIHLQFHLRNKVMESFLKLTNMTRNVIGSNNAIVIFSKLSKTHFYNKIIVN